MQGLNMFLELFFFFLQMLLVDFIFPFLHSKGIHFLNWYSYKRGSTSDVFLETVFPAITVQLD